MPQVQRATVVAPNTEHAKFTDTWTQLVTHGNANPAYAVSKYEGTKHYKELQRVAAMFDFAVEGLAAVDPQRHDASCTAFTITFSLVGETRPMQDMLESLFSLFLRAAKKSADSGEPIVLAPVEA